MTDMKIRMIFEAVDEATATINQIMDAEKNVRASVEAGTEASKAYAEAAASATAGQIEAIRTTAETASAAVAAVEAEAGAAVAAWGDRAWGPIEWLPDQEEIDRSVAAFAKAQDDIRAGFEGFDWDASAFGDAASGLAGIGEHGGPAAAALGMAGDAAAKAASEIGKAAGAFVATDNLMVELGRAAGLLAGSVGSTLLVAGVEMVAQTMVGHIHEAITGEQRLRRALESHAKVVEQVRIAYGGAAAAAASLTEAAAPTVLFEAQQNVGRQEVEYQAALQRLLAAPALAEPEFLSPLAGLGPYQEAITLWREQVARGEAGPADLELRITEIAAALDRDKDEHRRAQAEIMLRPIREAMKDEERLRHAQKLHAVAEDQYLKAGAGYAETAAMVEIDASLAPAMEADTQARAAMAGAETAGAVGTNADLAPVLAAETQARAAMAGFEDVAAYRELAAGVGEAGAEIEALVGISGEAGAAMDAGGASAEAASAGFEALEGAAAATAGAVGASADEIARAGASAATAAAQVQGMAEAMRGLAAGAAAYNSARASMAPPSGTAAPVAGGALSGFRGGGYTGDGADDEIAGYAHRNEYYFDAWTTSAIGVANLDALRASVRANGGLPEAGWDADPDVAAPAAASAEVVDLAAWREAKAAIDAAPPNVAIADPGAVMAQLGAAEGGFSLNVNPSLSLSLQVADGVTREQIEAAVREMMEAGGREIMEVIDEELRRRARREY